MAWGVITSRLLKNKTMIKFIQPPSGLFGLAYFEGDEAELGDIEKDLIESGVAIKAEPKKETATIKTVAENTEQKKKK